MEVSSDITGRIQKLLEEREQHTEAIEMIDATLAAVGAALGGSSMAAPARKPAPAKHTPTKAAPAKAAAKPMAAKPAPAKPSTRKPGKFAMSGEASILAFIKSKGSPVGRDIESNWKSEGRKGRAINAVSKLVREKKLKRVPLKGERGSKYSLA